MPTEMLTKSEHLVSPAPPPQVPSSERDLGAAAQRQARRVRRLKIHVAAWCLAAVVLTTLWVLVEWQANGALESFGHEGNPGQWNPTLWALGVGLWGLIVGIMALRVHFERPVTEAEVDREIERLDPSVTASAARARLERVGQLKFHVAAWLLGMIVLTPLWALIEWQDNGAFERFSNDSRPGEWEPWILYVGGLWALGIAILALRVYLQRPTVETQRGLERLRPGS